LRNLEYLIPNTALIVQPDTHWFQPHIDAAKASTKNIGSRERFLQPDEHVVIQVVSRADPATRTLSFSYETNLVFTGLTSDGTTIEYVGMEWIDKSGRRSGRSGWIV